MAARKAPAPKAVVAQRVMSAVVVLRNPESGELEVLLPGDGLPSWAESEVGEHALVPSAKPAAVNGDPVDSDDPAEVDGDPVDADDPAAE